MVAATRADYYEILGVARTATAGEIKRAYRSRARELHPDVSQEPDSEASFAELNEAYSVLSRSSSRLLYDRFGYRGRGHGWFDDWGAPGGDTVAEVELDAEEARRGSVRTVQYWDGEPCPDCDGEGAAPGAFVTTCPACEGAGRRRVRDELAAARLLRLASCPECGGRGRLVSDPCPRCDGGGRIATSRTEPVYIPAGVRSGEAVPLDDEGVVLVLVRGQGGDSPVVRALSLVGFLVTLALLVYLFVAR
jgi:molecular chaperone DnaJ